MTKRPYFCTITPTAYLERYARATQSPFHLILAHLLDPESKYFNPGYAEFYASTKRADETYIMDNGAFELGESYSPERLISVGNAVHADVLVLPDYPGKEYKTTIRAAEEFIPQFKAAGFDTFFVPQSQPGDWNGWLESFEWALFNPNVDVIGMSILAHPIALPHIPKCYVRVVAADRVVQWLAADRTRANAFAGKHIHWLGLLSPGLELPALLEMGVVDTLDSSGPVWFGHCGIHYNTFGESWSSVDKRFVPEVDFGAHANRHAGSIIEHNLSMVESLFSKFRTQKD